MQDHVHSGETGGGHVHFLAFQGDVLSGLHGQLQQQGAGAAGGVVGSGAGLGVLRGDAEDLGHDAADLGRGVELALALTALSGEVPHEILVSIAEDVVVIRAVFREIQLGLLEDGDKVGEPLDHGVSLAELVGVVEVREVALGQPGVGLDEGLDDVLVDPVADVGLALEGDHVLEAGARRDGHRRGHVIGVAVFVGDVFDEQHEEDVILVLGSIHAAAQFVARGPEG